MELIHKDKKYLISKDIKVGEIVSFIYDNAIFTDKVEQECSKTAYFDRSYKFKSYGYIPRDDCFKIMKEIK